MILKKYNQASNTGGKIRELKKKDVESLLKKLVQVSKWYGIIQSIVFFDLHPSCFGFSRVYLAAK